MNRTAPRNFTRYADLHLASPKQIDLIKKLLGEIAEYDRPFAVETWELMRELQNSQRLTMTKAGHEINTLLAVKGREVRAAEAAKTPVKLPEVPAGRYAVDNSEGKTAFYRVAVSDKGFVKLYAYSSDEQIEQSFPVMRVVLQKILDAGLDTAQERWGCEMKHCYRCGRKLTDEISRALGIGPDCRSK